MTERLERPGQGSCSLTGAVNVYLARSQQSNLGADAGTVCNARLRSHNQGSLHEKVKFKDASWGVGVRIKY